MSWVAAFFTLAGVFLLTRKSRWGWPVCLAGNMVWITFAVVTGQWAIFVLDAVFLGLNVYGWRRWSNGGK